MYYIGNDIISLFDLYNIRSFSDKRFLDKTLTDSELLFIKKSRELFFLPQLFWTCKETAYKIALKEGLNSGFVPQYFEVFPKIVFHYKNTRQISSMVVFKKRQYYVQSLIFPDYISSTGCNHEKITPYTYCTYAIANNNVLGAKARKHIIYKLAEYYNSKCNYFSIYKNNKGIPLISSFLNCQMPDISISHDGRYYSCAILFR